MTLHEIATLSSRHNLSVRAMMSSPTATSLDNQMILDVFRDRNLPTPSEDDVTAALRDDRARQWLDTRLRPDSFLSKEELDLYVYILFSLYERRDLVGWNYVLSDIQTQVSGFIVFAVGGSSTPNDASLSRRRAG